MDKKGNSFDIIRYFAAICIVLLHGTGYAYLTMEGIDFRPVNAIHEIVTFFPGVVIFFAMSGYFTAASLEKDSDVKSFTLKRIRRIYPELWISMLLNLIAISVIKKGLFWMDSSVGIWLLLQGMGVAFTPSCLKEFATGSINGPLWTLMVQLQFYVLLAVSFRYIKRLKLKSWLFVILPLSLFLNILSGYLAGLSNSINKMLERSLFPYLLWFFVGVFLYLFRKKFENRAYITGLLLGIYIIMYLLGKGLGGIFDKVFNYGYYAGGLRSLLTAVIIIGIGEGKLGLLPKKRIKFDISYEIFLFHWIVLNALVYFDCYNRIGWPATLLILLISSVMISALVWWLMFLIQKKRKVDNAP